MDVTMTGAGLVSADEAEVVQNSMDVVRLLVTDRGDVQVSEYVSSDRVGPPAHTHRWHEIEYVVEGAVEFLLDGEWHRLGAGGVQVLQAGAVHSVRVPDGEARVLIVTIGAPFDGFARDLAALPADATGPEVVAMAARHGVDVV
jgi:quercetin dioxygenase-like cupin family protein